VHVAVAAWAWDAYLGAGAAERGIRVKTSSFTRPAVNALPPRAKVSANYANSVLANLDLGA
jgi:branched-chain amino acid aminotransferase